MAGGHEVVTTELRGMAELCQRQADHFTTIEGHARDKGGDTSGFTGLLELLVPIVDGVVGLYAETLQFANGKMGEVVEKLNTAADQYEKQEQSVVDTMGTINSQVDSARDVQVGG